MQVGGALLDRDPEQIVDRAHHGSPTCEVAQIIQIVVRDGDLGGRRGTRLLAVEHGRQRRIDVVAGSNRDGDRPAQGQLYRTDRLALGRRRQRQCQRSGPVLKRKQPPLPQETRRHLAAGEAPSHQIGPLHPDAAIEGRELVGKAGCRELGQAEPIHVCRAATRDRRGAQDWSVGQNAPAGEMIDEIAWEHAQPSRIVPVCETDMTTITGVAGRR